jgi:hypothetical protein
VTADKEAAYSERIVIVQNNDPCWELPLSKNAGLRSTIYDP